MNTLGHAMGESEGWGLVGMVGGLPSIGWRRKEMLGGGGGEYFTFLGSFCAATHIIDKACSIAVIKQISVTQRATKTYLMGSLYKLRLFEVILSKTADFSDSQLPCWDFVTDFALKHLRSPYLYTETHP